MKSLLIICLVSSAVAFAEDDGRLVIEIPSSVQATITREKGETGKVRDFRRVDEEGGKAFSVTIVVDGKVYELSLDASGRLLRKQLEVREGEARPLRIETVPAKVRETLQREAGPGVIEDIEKIEEPAKFVTEVVIGKRKYRIEVAADGTLLDKEYLGDEE